MRARVMIITNREYILNSIVIEAKFVKIFAAIVVPISKQTYRRCDGNKESQVKHFNHARSCFICYVHGIYNKYTYAYSLFL